LCIKVKAKRKRRERDKREYRVKRYPLTPSANSGLRREKEVKEQGRKF